MAVRRNIGISCLEIPVDYVGGISSFTDGLLKGFAAIDTEHNFTLICSPDNYERFKKYQQHSNFSVIDAAKLTNTYRWKNILTKVAKKTGITLVYRLTSKLCFSGFSELISKRFDLIYFPSTTIFPINVSCSTAVSLHDIQYKHFPQHFSWLQINELTTTINSTVDKADIIQSSSKFIRDDLISVFGSKLSKKIVVIPEGVNSEYWNEREKDKTKLKCPDDPFLLLPAQMWPHKNHITVLKALKLLKESQNLEIPLLMTGAAYSGSKAIFNFIREHHLSRVEYLGKVSQAELRFLYQRATAVVVPSMYESSSLPLLEAMACGTSVIAADTPPNIEMEKHFTIRLFQTLDYEQLADELSAALKEKNHYAGLKNAKMAKQFDWHLVAKQYIEMFEKLLTKKK